MLSVIFLKVVKNTAGWILSDRLPNLGKSAVLRLRGNQWLLGSWAKIK